MDIRAAILDEHSKAQAQRIADWIGSDADRLKQLVDLFLYDEYRVVQRSAWIMGMVAQKHPAMIMPHLDAMVQRMQEPGLPVAVKRNVVRILQHITIPPELHGPVMNICFDLLGDVRETIAVRAFSMTVLANLSTIYPEIRNEIRSVIEHELEQQPSPGFISRAKKVLAIINAR